MKLSDFDFNLPEALIATRPARPRTSAKLLVAQNDEITDHHVSDLVSHLRLGDRLVLNDTKVIPARLTGQRHRDGEAGPTSAKIEVTLLQPDTAGNWQALVKPLRKVNDGEIVIFSDALQAVVKGRADGQATLAFNLSGDAFDAAIQQVGAMPLPPYIAAKRAADDKDNDDYQTFWARHLGAVAAPTASLHFDGPLLDQLKAIGVEFSFVTLHVGAGTFLPVKVDDIKDHKMHSEWGQVTPKAAAEINATKAADGLMTNFHLPKSTLMMLVSALMGVQQIKDIYAHAVAANYRFFSYGDASLLIPKSR